MANDALDPGPGNTYPYFPRRPDGTPYWSDDEATDGIALAGPDGIPRAPMPRGIRYLLRDDDERGAAQQVMIDVTPRHADGSPIAVPTLP